MKLSISKNANPNYLAKIVEISDFKPHPNADRLKLATVDGCVISTSIDTQPGIFIYFPLECQINQEYLSKNNLFRDSTLNSDPEKKGFFEENRRVRCIKFRGLASEGLIMPLSSLYNFIDGKDIMAIGDNVINQEFDAVDNILLVKKYIPKCNKLNNSESNSKSRNREQKYEELIVEDQFRFHIDTEQLKRNIDKVNLDDVVQITHKFHGTSGIFCNLLVKRRLPWHQKIMKLFGADVVTTEYKKFCSSRKVIKDPVLNKGLQQGYYNIDIWNLALDVLKPYLDSGMTIYAEIVGYLPNGTMIQKDYTYGCEYKPEVYEYSKMTPQQMYDKNLFKIYIYRITYTNIDGKVFEMSARNLQQYCKEKGLVSVIEDYYGTVDQFLDCNGVKSIDLAFSGRDWKDLFIELLSNKYLEKPCIYNNNTVPAEEIVLRIDKPKFEAYKLKSLAFYSRETALLDKGEIDIETKES